MCEISQKKSSQWSIFGRGLSPNETDIGSDLTVQGIPSRRNPERQKSQVTQLYPYPHTHTLAKQEALLNIRKKQRSPWKWSIPLLFSYLSNKRVSAVCSTPSLVILHRKNRVSIGYVGVNAVWLDVKKGFDKSWTNYREKNRSLEIDRLFYVSYKKSYLRMYWYWHCIRNRR